MGNFENLKNDKKLSVNEMKILGRIVYTIKTGQICVMTDGELLAVVETIILYRYI